MNAQDETHAEALADLRRRHRRAKQYADEAAAAGDTRRLRKALIKFYTRAEQLDYAANLPAVWVCPECEKGEQWSLSLFEMKIRDWWNCPIHWEPIAEERARAHLAEQLEAMER